MDTLLSRSIILCIAAHLCAFAGDADQYTYATIDEPDAIQNSFGTQISGINNAGQVVGTFENRNNKLVGFVYDGSAFQVVDLSSVDTFLNGINDSGVIVGAYFTGPAADFGFQLRNGVVTTIPGSIGAGGVNNSGVVAATSGYAGIIYDNGTSTTVRRISAQGVPLNTNFTGINNLGQIVGYTDSFVTGSFGGFVYQDGRFFDVQLPGANSGIPYGINDSGTIVGLIGQPYSGPSFVLEDGVYSTFNVPGSTGTEALGINNAGQIVGSYQDATGMHGFIATPTPVPEPSSALPFAIVFGVVAVFLTWRGRTTKWKWGAD